MGTWPCRLSHSIILQSPAWNGAESGGWGGGWLCRFDAGWRKQDRWDGQGHLNERGPCQPKGARSKSQLCIGCRQHRGVHETVQSWMFQRPRPLRSGSKGPKIILQMEGDTKHTALLFISIVCGSLWVSVGLCGYFVFLCDHFESPRGYFKFLGVFFYSSWYSWEALWSFCVSLVVFVCLWSLWVSSWSFCVSLLYWVCLTFCSWSPQASWPLESWAQLNHLVIHSFFIRQSAPSPLVSQQYPLSFWEEVPKFSGYAQK